MNNPLILTEKIGLHTTVLILNRPEKRNALNTFMMTQLCDAIKHISADHSQRILVLRGAGEVFCAGLDLQEASNSSQVDSLAHLIARLLKAIYQSHLITIAAIHGAALAGGAGLMSACDFVIASKETKIGYPEVHRGLVAGLVMTFLCRQLRERDILKLLLTGESIGANHAQSMGLINQVIKPTDLMRGVKKLVETLLKGGPEAMQRTKQNLHELWPCSIEEDFEIALEHHLAARHSKEAEEGIRAFLENRPPNWNKSIECA